MPDMLDRRRVAAVLVLAVSGGLHAVGRAQGSARKTLTGAAAQNSPQADVLIAYEDALIDGGLDAAARHAAPSKVKENQDMLKAFGAESFKQMLAARKAERLPPAQRRRQIVKVEIDGDYAYLEAQSGRKGVLDVAGFEKTSEGWKVAPVRR